MPPRTHLTRRAQLAAPIAIAAALSPIAPAQHLTLGSAPDRVARTDGQLDPGPSDLTTPLWVFPASDPTVAGPIAWIKDAGPVVANDLVIAVSGADTSGTPARMWAVRREDGSLAWSADLPNQLFDSWTTPTIDRVNRTVLYATGRPGADAGVVQARRLTDGHLLWETALDKDVVNATVLVTTNRAGRDRAFVTDYEGFYAGGDGATLYCINLDPYLNRHDPDGYPPDNPYQPGEIVWRVPLQSGASGATPAYDGRDVYLATAGDFDFAAGGAVLAFHAGATDAANALAWRSDTAGDNGFFGGVAVHDGAVFAATYNYNAGTSSARLLKLDASDGSLLWSTPSNRTDSIPIPLDDGRIVLSTGIPGYGSAPTVQVFQDLGSSAALIDDSAHATWHDDGDGLLEPGEFDVLGGWTHQPCVVDHHPLTGAPVLFVGSIDVPAAGQFSRGYTRLSMIDLTRGFADPTCVLSTFDGAGSSPAIVQRSLYTIGADGLYAFGLPYALDVNADGRTDLDDLYAWYQPVPNRDVNRDALVNADDARALQAELRRHEQEDANGGRP